MVLGFVIRVLSLVCSKFFYAVQTLFYIVLAKIIQDGGLNWKQ